jgi:hypothetical protein
MSRKRGRMGQAAGGIQDILEPLRAVVFENVKKLMGVSFISQECATIPEKLG